MARGVAFHGLLAAPDGREEGGGGGSVAGGGASEEGGRRGEEGGGSVAEVAAVLRDAPQGDARLHHAVLRHMVRATNPTPSIQHAEPYTLDPTP